MPKENVKTIILFSPVFPPSHGGGGLRLYKTYKRLKQRLPLNVIVVTEAGRHYTPGWAKHDDFDVFAIPQDAGIRDVISNIPSFLSKAPLSKINTIHILGLTKSGYIAAMLAYLCRIPRIVELTVNPDIETNTLKKKLAFLPYKHAQLAIALNKTILGFLRGIGVPAKRIWLRPNPVESDAFPPISAEQKALHREKLKLPKGVHIHGVFGRLCKRKNQVAALEALKKLPENHTLILAGPSLPDDAEYIKLLKSTVKTENLEDRVHIWNEHISDPLKIYHAIDTLWLPSINEGLPNVMIEALCCGVPVIANVELGLDDYIQHGSNGFLSTLNPDEFAKCVLEATNIIDENKRLEISERAKLFYDYKTHDDALEGKLRDVLKM